MRSFTMLRKTVARGDACDTVKLTVHNIRISAPRIPPPVPTIVVTPPLESSEWDPRDARPNETSITPRRKSRHGRARRGRPSGPRPLPPASVCSLSTSAHSTKKSTKRHAVGGFAQIMARATDPTEDFARYREAMRREIWGGVEIGLPADGVFTVVVPGSSTSRKEFKFGKGMQYEDAYRHFVTYLSDETNRPQSAASMVFVSRSYPDAIYDAKSYKTWLMWMKGRDARDRILMVV